MCKAIYPCLVQVRVPHAIADAMTKAAAREMTTRAEFARRLFIEKLTNCGALKLPGDDGGPDGFSPASGMQAAA